MDITKIPVGSNPPKEINVIIEIPQGSPIKYEFDKKLGIVKVDRFNYTAMVYPFNYGFIPNSFAQDGDPVDVLVISSHPIAVGSLISCRPIGLLEMEDEEGIDTKIIALPIKKIDPFYKNIEDISQLPDDIKNLIKHFFDHYKELEPGKWVKTKNFLNKEEAYKNIKKALKS